MVRTALYSLAAALGLALPIAAGTAQAHPPVPYPTYPVPYPSTPPAYPSYRPPIQIAWKVLYRTCDHEPWRRYGTYRNEARARHTAHHLRCDGYQVTVLAAY